MNYLNSEWLERLKDRIELTRVNFFGTVLPMPEGELFPADLVSHYVFHKGRLIPAAALQLLICRNEKELLIRFVRESDPTARPILYILHKALIENNIEGARGEFDYQFGKHSLRIDRISNTLTLLILSRIFNDEAAVSEYVTHISNMAGKHRTEQLITLAYIEKFVKENETEAIREYIEEAERNALSGDDWGMAAEAWLVLFEDAASARRCMDNGFEYWIKRGNAGEPIAGMAKMWYQYFFDKAKAVECLEILESRVIDYHTRNIAVSAWLELGNDAKAKQLLTENTNAELDAEDWCRTAEVFMDLTGDLESVKECLEKGENVSDGLFTWTDMAKGWYEYADDRERCLKCLEKASGYVTSGSEWFYCAETYAEISENDHALQCLDKAVKIGAEEHSCNVLLNCAELLDRLDGEQEKITAVLEHAEACASESEHWLMLAWFYKYINEDPVRINECLSKGEAVINPESYGFYPRTLLGRVNGGELLVPNESRILAKLWMGLAGDVPRAQALITKESESAQSVNDWIDTADDYLSLFQDKESAKRCLAEASARAGTTEECIQTARCWLNYFADWEKAEELLIDAEEMGQQFSDWSDLAYEWMEAFGNREKALFCIQKASQGEGDYSDGILMSVPLYANVLNDNEKIAQCIAEAEKAAKLYYDWYSIAGAYYEYKYDREKINQCFRQALKCAEEDFEKEEVTSMFFDYFGGDILEGSEGNF